MILRTPEFTVGTWDMPELRADLMPIIWLSGRKFVTAVVRGFVVMQVFPVEALTHREAALRWFGKQERVVSAGFTERVGQHHLAAIGRSTSLDHEPEARSEDTIMLNAFLAFCEQQKVAA